MVKETVSPCAASPPTEPVTAMVPAASVALMMSSAVMLSTEMVAEALVSTVWVEVVVAENELPALSVPVTVASKDVSAARSEPATSMEKSPAGINGARVGGAVDGEGDGVAASPPDGTGDGDGAGGFCGVDDVISGDVVNGDGCRALVLTV